VRNVRKGPRKEPAKRGREAAVGFTVKSGWACAVLLAGPSTAPRVADSCRVQLSDPAVPDARQPYHAGFGAARTDEAQLSRLVSGVKRFGAKSVRELLKRYGDAHLRGAGIVVGSLVDPKTIANDHIRIHALEGKLFREVVADAAKAAGLRSAIWRERDLYAAAAGALKRPEGRVRASIGALGRDVAGPWRAEQKHAALAAWLVLAD
jgi:hypothetical protein